MQKGTQSADGYPGTDDRLAGQDFTVLDEHEYTLSVGETAAILGTVDHILAPLVAQLAEHVAHVKALARDLGRERTLREVAEQERDELRRRAEIAEREARSQAEVVQQHLQTQREAAATAAQERAWSWPFG